MSFLRNRHPHQMKLTNQFSCYRTLPKMCIGHHTGEDVSNGLYEGRLLLTNQSKLLLMNHLHSPHKSLSK